MAHEIGHNLGLPHITEFENLMQEGGAPNQGERLNNAQKNAVLASNFATPIPVPSGLLLMATGLIGLIGISRFNKV